MKQFNTTFTDAESFRNFIIEQNIIDSKDNLIQVFAGTPDKKIIQKMVSDITGILPDSQLIGTTTSSEICNSKILTKNTVVAISVFDKTKVQTGFIECGNDAFRSSRMLRKELESDNLKAIILFSDGLKSNGEQVLNGMTINYPGTLIGGGRAGDNGMLCSTYVFDKFKISDNAIVAASFSSSVLQVSNFYSLNWVPIGKTMTVTRAEENRLYEVDGMTVKEMYRKYLGQDIAAEMPYSCGEFPLLKQTSGQLVVARGVLQAFDDGSILIGGSLNNGDMVRLGFGDVELIVKQRNKIFQLLAQQHVDALFIYSCTARLSFLQNEASQAELGLLNNIAANAGFYTYGEYYHGEEKNELLNLTMTLLTFSENKPLHPRDIIPIENQPELTMFEGKRYNILRALTVLSNTVTKELEQSNIELSKLASTDFLTGICNRRCFFKNGKAALFLAKRSNVPISLCLIDLDDFKKINDRFGHQAGDAVLKLVATTIKNKSRKSDQFGRVGGEEFALLLYDTNIAGARHHMNTIREMIGKLRCEHEGNLIQVTLSVGVTQFSGGESLHALYQQADMALYEAKDAGKNKVFCYAPHN